MQSDAVKLLAGYLGICMNNDAQSALGSSFELQKVLQTLKIATWNC